MNCHDQRPSTPTLPPLKWRDTLSVRLAAVINITVILVVGAFWAIDYRRERAVHLREQQDALREEAKVLRVARMRYRDFKDFQGFVDDFCIQMDSAASAGHHILVFDQDGNVIARAHQRADAGLEDKMASARRGRPIRFAHNGDNFIAVGLDSRDRETIVVAQSLAFVEQIIHDQAFSRAISMGTLVVLIFGVTSGALLIWVRRPLRELVGSINAITHRDFGVRIRPSGSRELQYLAAGVNEMAGALEQVETHRHAEMSRARAIQRSLLPKNGRSIAGYELAALFLPTDSVGGDIYDIVELRDGSTLLVILDVSGHGVPAALYTALLRTCLRHYAATTLEPDRIAEAVNNELTEVVASEAFATCFLVRLIPASGTVEYIGAGHDPAVVVRADGKAETLKGSGLPLGVEPGTTYDLLQSKLNPGDRLFIFTDGLHEVFDENETQFGRERLTSLLAKTSNLPPQGQLDAVIQAVRSFRHGTRFDDDITLLCVLRKEGDPT